MQLPTYDLIKEQRAFAAARRRGVTCAVMVDPLQPSIPSIIVATILSKVVASSVMYPHEVVRARIMADNGCAVRRGAPGDAPRERLGRSVLGRSWHVSAGGMREWAADGRRRLVD